MIPGLRYIPSYLDPTTHDELLAAADAGPWRQFFGARRMQIYGYGWDLRKGGVYRVEDLPAWAHEIAARLQRDKLMPELPDQLIVNEYPAGEGIDAHVDAQLFTDTIVSISLGSTCTMEFTNDAGAREEQFLEPMSALVIAGEARSQWKHAIPTRTHDTWLGRDCPRARRVSLTFRKMRLQGPPSSD